MSHSASFIPPHVSPPDPPEARAAVLVFSIIMSVLLFLVIGLVSIDFFAEMAGFPLVSETRQSPPDAYQFAEEGTMKKLKNHFELVTPKHQTQMKGPEIVVIYTQHLPEELTTPRTMPPELLLDGSPHPWEEQYGNNTWFARLQLQAGQHHVQVEESEADFFVETVDSPLRLPEQWAWNRPHPDTDKTDRCFDCHEKGDHPIDPLTMGRNAIGTWQGIDSCFACHEEEEHQTLHAIVQPASKQCLRCHTIH
jgi:hypothetical protein